MNPKLHDIPIMVFDVESVGLHGEGYAVGYVVILNGEEVESGMMAADPQSAYGDDHDRMWIEQNIPPLECNFTSPSMVAEKFWQIWEKWRTKGAILAADCAWPVETRFLSDCVKVDTNERKFSGPYPLLEISSWMMAAGQDPLIQRERLPKELPQHNPLADARQSARLLLNAITITHNKL